MGHIEINFDLNVSFLNLEATLAKENLYWLMWMGCIEINFAPNVSFLILEAALTIIN